MNIRFGQYTAFSASAPSRFGAQPTAQFGKQHDRFVKVTFENPDGAIIKQREVLDGSYEHLLFSLV